MFGGTTTVSRHGDSAPAQVPAPVEGTALAGQVTSAAVGEMGQLAGELSDLSAQIVGISGEIQSLSENLSSQAEFLNELKSAMRALTDSNHRIADAVATANSAAGRAESEVAASGERLNEMLSVVESLVGDVTRSKRHVDGLVQSVERVENVATTINEIARQTNILALNATVEAARAGAAGRGFGVLAKEVKTLSDQTARATKEIHDTLSDMKGHARRLGEYTENNVNRAQTVNAGTEAMRQSIDAITETVRESAQQSTQILQETEENSAHFSQIEQQMVQAADSLSGTSDRVDGYLDDLKRIGESTFKMAFDAGVDTTDTRRAHYMLSKRDEIQTALEAAVDSGEIWMGDLFDENYRKIPNTEPQKYTTRFDRVTDRIVPAICEEVFDIYPDTVSMVPVDRNGLIATHNRCWGHDPRPNDPLWNTRYSRSRRFFNDAVGLRAARNTEDLIVQSYRRPLGGGEFQDLVEFSAPIFVKGRHWGAIRMNYTKSRATAR